MKEHKQILLANRAWAREILDEDGDFFRRQSAGQSPRFLWIGCSDSRVSPEQITDMQPGGMFLHRNIANLVHADDLNLLSVLQYAVDVLKVPHIVLCGHYGCGGIIAALDGDVSGPVDKWLEEARRVLRDHADEIDGSGDHEARVSRFVEMNVLDQLLNLARTETVQSAFRRGQELTLFGWVYDIRDGHLKPMIEIDHGTPLDSVPRPERVLDVSTRY